MVIQSIFIRANPASFKTHRECEQFLRLQSSLEFRFSDYRPRLELTPIGTSGFKCHRTGQRRRKSVRGCIVGRDLGTIACVVVDKGGNEKAGLTDVIKPRRLGPKRANRIRKFFGLPRHWDLKNKKTDNKSKVEVERFDVTRYVVKRPSKTVDGKAYYKV